MDSGEGLPKGVGRVPRPVYVPPPPVPNYGESVVGSRLLPFVNLLFLVPRSFTTTPQFLISGTEEVGKIPC